MFTVFLFILFFFNFNKYGYSVHYSNKAIFWLKGESFSKTNSQVSNYSFAFPNEFQYIMEKMVTCFIEIYIWMSDDTQLKHATALIFVPYFCSFPHLFVRWKPYCLVAFLLFPYIWGRQWGLYKFISVITWLSCSLNHVLSISLKFSLF